MILLDSSHDSWENEVLFVKISHLQIPSGQFPKNQPESYNFMGLKLMFYALISHEIKKKCTSKLIFTFINKNIVDRW